MVLPNPFETIGLQRNFAIGRAQSAWILVIDADERATPELEGQIARAIRSQEFEAYRIPRRNVFLGAEVRHGGWETDRPIRLFRASLRYSDNRVHEHVEVSGPLGELSACLTPWFLSTGLRTLKSS